jgi:hypothetical protein
MNHHMTGTAHDDHEAGTQRPVSFSTAPPGVPTLDKLGPVNERFSALGVALMLAWLAWGTTRLAVPTSVLTLTGIAPRPPAPPPKALSAPD